MSYLRTAVAMVGIAASVALPLKCSTPSVSTINEDDGTHQFGPTGKWAWGHGYSPHGAGIACKWELQLQKKNWKRSVRIARGTEQDTVFVNAPPAGARIWLYSNTCGRWEKVK